MKLITNICLLYKKISKYISNGRVLFAENRIMCYNEYVIFSFSGLNDYFFGNNNFANDSLKNIYRMFYEYLIRQENKRMKRNVKKANLTNSTRYFDGSFFHLYKDALTCDDANNYKCCEKKIVSIISNESTIEKVIEKNNRFEYYCKYNPCNEHKCDMLFDNQTRFFKVKL